MWCCRPPASCALHGSLLTFDLDLRPARWPSTRSASGASLLWSSPASVRQISSNAAACHRGSDGAPGARRPGGVRAGGRRTRYVPPVTVRRHRDRQRTTRSRTRWGELGQIVLARKLVMVGPVAACLVIGAASCSGGSSTGDASASTTTTASADGGPDAPGPDKASESTGQPGATTATAGEAMARAGGRFAVNVERALGRTLTDTEKWCLAEAYAELDQAELEGLVLQSLAPGVDGPAGVGDVWEELERKCKIDLMR